MFNSRLIINDNIPNNRSEWAWNLYYRAWTKTKATRNTIDSMSFPKALMHNFLTPRNLLFCYENCRLKLFLPCESNLSFQKKFIFFSFRDTLFAIIVYLFSLNFPVYILNFSLIYEVKVEITKLESFEYLFSSYRSS